MASALGPKAKNIFYLSALSSESTTRKVLEVPGSGGFGNAGDPSCCPEQPAYAWPSLLSPFPSAGRGYSFTNPPQSLFSLFLHIQHVLHSHLFLTLYNLFHTLLYKHQNSFCWLIPEQWELMDEDSFFQLEECPAARLSPCCTNPSNICPKGAVGNPGGPWNAGMII